MPAKTEILGVRVDIVDWSRIEEICRQFLGSTTARQIVTVNGEFILAAQKDLTFRDIINRADLVIPDSTNVVWASKMTNRRLESVTPGVDLVERLAKLALETDQSIFLLGGRGEVAKRASQNLVDRFQGLKIAGVSATNPDDRSIVRIIHHSQAAIVLVAYGHPHQERWIASNRRRTGAKILVGVGGAFDMLSGRLRRAPQWLRDFHLEWLWRLILQPTRLPRIWRALVVFPLRVVLAARRR